MKTITVFALVCITACILSLVHAQSNLARAVCRMEGTLNCPSCNGTLSFSFDPNTQNTRVTGTITGLPANSVHGFHIHEFGHVGTVDGLGVGGHFNPTISSHSLPGVTATRHAGDMGNVTTDANGVATVDLSSNTGEVLFSLNGTRSIIGRGVIVHQRRDNGDAPTNGDAGSRFAQCVIGIAKFGSTIFDNDAYVNDQQTWQYATCEVRGAYPGGTGPNGRPILGRVTFEQTGSSLRVRAKVCGLSSVHGFHVHEYGDITAASDRTLNSGAHFDPYRTATHSDATSASRHAGDLGNITITDLTTNTATYDTTLTSVPSLNGNFSIIGRMLVIHIQRDLGSAVQPSGDSGTKIAACVIGGVNNLVSLDDIACPLVPQPSKKSAAPQAACTSYLLVLLLSFAAFVAHL